MRRAQEGRAAASGISFGPIAPEWKHPLDVEAGRLLELSIRLGRRLRVALVQTDKANAKLHDLDGALYQPKLPDEAWRETFKLYDKSVSNLLREQRERIALGLLIRKVNGGTNALTEEEYKSELATIAQEHLLEMSEDEFKVLRAKRTAAKAERGSVIEVKP